MYAKCLLTWCGLLTNITNLRKSGTIKRIIAQKMYQIFQFSVVYIFTFRNLKQGCLKPYDHGGWALVYIYIYIGDNQVYWWRVSELDKETLMDVDCMSLGNNFSVFQVPLLKIWENNFYTMRLGCGLNKLRQVVRVIPCTF